jgi:beta-galactosidase/beta-glucuronidase
MSLTDLAAAAPAPSKKSTYREGPSDRYMLDGRWLHRADPADNGVQSGFQTQTSTQGWAPTTVPHASNAGDFSIESYTGQVHWYRKDFNLPKGTSPSDNFVFRFESVNYRAKAWLNGKPIGFNVGAYLPFEFRAKGMKKGENRLVVQVDSRRKTTPRRCWPSRPSAAARGTRAARRSRSRSKSGTTIAAGATAASAAPSATSGSTSGGRSASPGVASRSSGRA